MNIEGVDIIIAKIVYRVVNKKLSFGIFSIIKTVMLLHMYSGTVIVSRKSLLNEFIIGHLAKINLLTVVFIDFIVSLVIK